MSASDRRAKLDRAHPELSIRRQCAMLGLARSGVYRKPRPANDNDLEAMRRIDALYTERPFFGARRIARTLIEEGFPIDRKRARRLMRLMGIEALGPKPRTSKPTPGHKIYPYLLRGLSIERAVDLSDRRGHRRLQRRDRERAPCPPLVRAVAAGRRARHVLDRPGRTGDLPCPNDQRRAAKLVRDAGLHLESHSRIGYLRRQRARERPEQAEQFLLQGLIALTLAGQVDKVDRRIAERRGFPTQRSVGGALGAGIFEHEVLAWPNLARRRGERRELIALRHAAEDIEKTR